MTSGAMLLAITAVALGVFAVATCLVIARHARQETERMHARLDALETRMVQLARDVAALATPDVSEAAPASVSPASVSPANASPASVSEVPLITRVVELDEVDPSGTRVASVTLAGPLIKAAALTHGVRRALHEEQRMRISYAIRKELRQQRKMRRRRRVQQQRFSDRRHTEGWGP